MPKHYRFIYPLEFQRTMHHVCRNINPGGGGDDVCFRFITLTHDKFNLCPEFLEIHRVATNKIQDFGHVMPVSFRNHFVSSINGTQYLCKRLIPPCYRGLLSDSYK